MSKIVYKVQTRDGHITLMTTKTLDEALDYAKICLETAYSAVIVTKWDEEDPYRYGGTPGKFE